MSTEIIVHNSGVRIRVTGSGLLRLRLMSLNYVKNFELLPLKMEETTDREPTRLASFNSQRMFLKIYTENLNEHFNINRIISFIKPIATQFPG